MVARWTWPSEAAAIGTASKLAKAFDMRTPSSEVMICSTSSKEKGSTLSWSRESACM